MEAQRAPHRGRGPRRGHERRPHGPGRVPGHGPGRGRGTGPRFVPGWAADDLGVRLPVRSTVAATVLVLVGTSFSAHGQPHRTGLDAGAWLLLLLACLPLVLRFRHPVTVLYVVVGAVLAYVAAGYPYGPVFLAPAVAVFAAVVTGHRYPAWGAAAALWTGHALVVHWLYRRLPPPGGPPAGWAGETAVAAWTLVLLALSELLRVRREQWTRERRARAQAETRRRDEERLRIAQELHDVLAHSISVVNVQAGVGLALLDSDPEAARTALSTIKTASKEALGEVRQVLDALRTPGDAPRAPAPGLDRLPELVEQAASAGLTVATEVVGTPFRLPPGTDLAAFRLVQEALTNVVRHSGSRTADVRIGYRPGAVDLRVDDAGPATGADAGGSGNGLTGMRERAAALGGRVEAGERPDGGFRVRAVLPVENPARDAPTAPAPPRCPQERP
ncbi:sensor histidine kinase [Streptomyces sp. 8L]|uniref:sensor histidine kinase n=1 Tax=Streptomyces sp. 8L TaxID=2877242 RepID=UPI001CD3045F|nr:sensor histidine kinase [Streptomyces sp. 8L]MCA1217320.1 sensor histidine kinase [Streptomyces sp. 8L]